MRSLTLLLVVTTLFAEGCCRDGERKCDGLTRLLCRQPATNLRGPEFETEETCAVACIERGNDAFCALSTEPDPECPTNLPGAGGYCIGARALNCRYGFKSKEQTCPVACAVTETDHDILCALTSTPDPRCVAVGTRGTRCDGEQWMRCEQGYPIAALDCGTGQPCRESQFYIEERQVYLPFGFCPLESTAEPRCMPPSETHGAAISYCDGNVSVDCLAGYVVYRETCPTTDGGMCYSVPGSETYCSPTGTPVGDPRGWPIAFEGE